jgi:hypothetical protein
VLFAAALAVLLAPADQSFARRQPLHPREVDINTLIIDTAKLLRRRWRAYLDENYSRTNDDIRPGRYALIAVSDTGTGIPAAILDKVFDPFFTSKGSGKGTGLGLSMVYGFIKQSAGHIKISSEGGHGTTIKMYLPPGMGTRRFPKASPSLRSKAVTRRSLSSRTTGW